MIKQIHAEVLYFCLMVAKCLLNIKIVIVIACVSQH